MYMDAEYNIWRDALKLFILSRNKKKQNKFKNVADELN